jgi:hypothetical protein
MANLQKHLSNECLKSEMSSLEAELAAFGAPRDDVLTSWRGLENGIKTTLEHREWLCKSVRTLYGVDVSTKLQTRLKELLHGVRRLRITGQIISSWETELGTFESLDLLRLAGLTEEDMFAGAKIDECFWLTKRWDTNWSDEQNFEQLLCDVRSLYGDEGEYNFKRLFLAVRRRFYNTQAAIKSIIRQDFGSSAFWLKTAYKFEQEVGDKWFWGHP